MVLLTNVSGQSADQALTALAKEIYERFGTVD